MTELLLLAALAIIAMLWVDQRRVQELAVARSRRACEAAGVQFLDDTAALRGIKLMRDAQGVIRLWRRFTFDYSSGRGDRQQGMIVMLGNSPIALELANQTTWIDGN